MPHDQTASAQPASPRYLLRSLGNADVIVEGVSVVWPARSAEELLWYLHAHPQGRHRHECGATLLRRLDGGRPGGRGGRVAALGGHRHPIGRRAYAEPGTRGVASFHPIHRVRAHRVR